MCLILVAWRQHERFPFFLAANRDEFHARPAAPARWWPGRPRILAGRDLSAGGTWLGVTPTGRFAALTNFRDPRPHGSPAPKTPPPSRGALVVSLLQSRETVAESLERLRAVGGLYNGFSMIFSDGERLGIYESAIGEGRELDPGIYGLSNHLLDTPWPKVVNSKTLLKSAIDDEQAALALLRDDQPPPDEQLPRTGVDPDLERRLSCVFVRGEDYGTRCSTIMSVDEQGHARFDEWSWDAHGAERGRVRVSFHLPPGTFLDRPPQ